MTVEQPRNTDGRFARNGLPKWHKGYPVVYAPTHPRARQNGYVYAHILIVEETIGRTLAPGEVIHHRNGVKTDNAPENLQVLPSHATHMRIHWRQRSVKFPLNGNEYTLRELSEIHNIPYSCLYQRIYRLHWPIARALGCEEGGDA